MAHARKVMRPSTEPAMMMTVMALVSALRTGLRADLRKAELVVAAVSVDANVLMTLTQQW